MSPDTDSQDPPVDPDLRRFEQQQTVVAETPDLESIHTHQLVAIEKNHFTQFHYYVVGYDTETDRIHLNEAGSHDFPRSIDRDRFSDSDVELVTADDGSPIWGY